jgi:hypothetical protein
VEIIREELKEAKRQHRLGVQPDERMMLTKELMVRQHRLDMGTALLPFVGSYLSAGDVRKIL